MTSSHCQCDGALRADILRAAAEAGACAAGFVAVEPVTDEARIFYDRWIRQGRHAGMEYMERYADIRNNPARLLEGARSMLCVAFRYATPAMRRHPLFADYALGRDYHEVLRRRLAPLAALMENGVAGSATRVCVDTAPLRERYWAARAGLGFIGINNQLIVPGIGSRVFLAEVLWTVGAEPSPPCPTVQCRGCMACVRACPGKALAADGTLDSRRCLSYLTIEHRGPLPAWLNLRGRRIYGCDLCQDVCPHNHDCPPTPVLPEFEPSEALLALDLDAVRAMDQPAFSSIFSHSAVKRCKLASLLRNANA